MAEQARERGSSGQLTWLWALLSIGLVVGFLYWLAVTAEPTTVAAAPGDSQPGEEQPAPSGLQEISLSELTANVPGFRGLELEVRGVSVVAPLSEQLFWTQAESGGPLLVKVDTAAIRTVGGVRPGVMYSVRGTVAAMSPDVIASWKESGAIRNAAEEEEAGLAANFLNVVSLRAAAP